MAEEKTSLATLAALFLKMGLTAFGGPAAHVAIMEQEVVRRRGWLSHADFMDMLGMTNLIPGPNSTEMAIHIGYRRAGLPGLLVAGSCFIFPAAVLATVLGWAYLRFSKLPAVEAVLYGVKPVIIAVVAQAVWNLRRSALKNATLWVVGILAFLLAFLQVNELMILFGAGAVMVMLRLGDGRRRIGLPAVAPLALGPAATLPAAAAVGLWPVFLVFLKIGSVLFGSGYVLLAFLRADLVEHRHWLTPGQLLDAVAVGQVTPGPVFTTATFIGYVLTGSRGVRRGVAGAAVATVGIFLPAFVFVAITAPLIGALRKSRMLGALLDWLNVASLALMAAVTVQLAREAIVDVPSVVLAVISAVALLRFRVNSMLLACVGAAAGPLIVWVRG